MPIRDKAIKLTFSKRNKDVEEIIFKKKESDPLFVITDYLSDAIRFYEKNKNSKAVDFESMKKYFDLRAEELKISLINRKIDLTIDTADNKSKYIPE